MKKLYSIGETAKIMGISTQTLRSYTNMDLVRPAVVNPQTGYRYYSYDQLHYIDRIKYLRSLGVPLKEISDILHSGKPETMIQYLQKQHHHLETEIEKLQTTLSEVAWYTDYFKQLDDVHLVGIPYAKKFPERYMMYTPYVRINEELDFLSEENKEYMEISMMRLKNNVPYLHHRQWGIAVDFKAYTENQFIPQQYFFFFKEKPPVWDESYMAVVPAGTYLCLWCESKMNIHAELVREFYQSHDKPTVAMALEIENSFNSYTQCPYEYQTFIEINEKDKEMY